MAMRGAERRAKALARTQRHAMRRAPMPVHAWGHARWTPRRRATAVSPRVAAAWSRVERKISCHGRLFS